tara:strand:- start:2401 stop:4491 length:2091 start_codon:yes stop_codon:yes gene_type:complete
MAIEDQMEMNFGDVPDNTIGIDPVSGNEIPLGSNAENVRDDIPANLSEGEIVIPADVVNFHGVKLFEDLRAEAKMGYAQMAADGRMGGEPMMEDMDIEITIEDIDVMDDEEPVEMYRGGTSMAQYKGVTKNRNIKSSKPMTAAQHQAKIRGGSYSKRRRGSKPAPSAQAAAAASAAKAAPTNVAAVNPNAGPTIAQQINFGGKGGFDFRDKRNPVQKLLGIGDSGPEAQVRKSAEAREQFRQTMDAARNRRIEKEEQADLGSAASGSTGSDPLRTPAGANQSGGSMPNTYSVYDGTQGKTFGEVIGALDPRKLFMDEGGLVNPEPFYSQKGGFDLSSTNTVVVEYMNDEGHRIFITFVDGVPQMEIPEGYYPAGDAVSLDDVVNYTIPTMDGISPEPVQQRTRVSDRDKPETPAPTPVNYKELSIDELKDMIADQRTMGSKIFAGLSPITKLIMWDKTRRTKAEIERRIADPNTSEVDLMRLKNLKELLDREEPGLIKTLLDKVQGKEFERIVSQIPKPVTPDVDYSDPTLAPDQGIAKTYTPDPQESSQMTMPFEGSTYDEVVPMTTPGVDAPVTPGVPLTRAQIEAAKKASEEAAAVVFGQPKVEEEAAPAEQVAPFTPTPISKDEQRRKDRQEKSKNLQGKSTKRKTGLAQSATRGLSSREKQGGAALDTRFGISGLNKGGLATKKGKKKKSK